MLILWINVKCLDLTAIVHVNNLWLNVTPSSKVLLKLSSTIFNVHTVPYPYPQVVTRSSTDLSTPVVSCFLVLSLALLNAVCKLSDLVKDGSAFGHELSNLAIRVNHGGVIASA